MNDPLGLSIGTTNLVAARAGRPAVTRRSVLTLFAHRPPEVGVPGENPNLGEPGIVMAGFVERFGDPVPLVAADGTSYRADQLIVDALDALVSGTGGPAPAVAIAVPAHWDPAALGALRAALRSRPNLAPNGVPAVLVTDAAAAFAALDAHPGLPARGVVALLDFGGSGTSITLADAPSNFEPIAPTVRYADFSGEQVDQAVLARVADELASAGNIDPAGTAAVGSLARLRTECRQAKERLSTDTATDIAVDLPGHQSRVRLTRPELEGLTQGSLGGVIVALEDMLERNRIARANLGAVAIVGGSASIPLIAQRFSERLHVPVVTTPQPGVCTAAGAALVAARGPDSDTPTGIAPAAAVAAEAAFDGPGSATSRALAWSQDETADGYVAYTGEDYSFDAATTHRPAVEYVPAAEPVDQRPVAWYRRTAILVGVFAILPLIAVGGFAYKLTGEDSPSRSEPSSAVTTTTRTTRTTTPPPVAPPPTSQAPVTTVETVAPPPPPVTVTAPRTVTITPTTTTATPPTTTTTTTTATTTTTTTTTTATPSTTLLTIPFLPVPIPIQVPPPPQP